MPLERAKWLNFLFLVPFLLQESTDQSSIQSQVLCARLKYFVQEYTQVLCARIDSNTICKKSTFKYFVQEYTQVLYARIDSRIYSSTLCKNRLKYYMQEE